MSDEAAAPVAAPEAAPVAAPVAADDSGGDDFAALAARAEAAAGGEAPASTTATADGEEAPKLPEPRPAPQIRSARERILAKQAAAAERQRVQPVEQQAKAYQEQLVAIQAEQARIEQQAKDAIAKGDVNTALKLRGLGTFEEVQRRYLESKGAIAPVSPELAEKLKKVDEWEATQKQKEQKEAELRARQEAQQDYQAFRKEVETDLTSHKIAGLSKFTGVGGFVDQLTEAMAADPELTLEQAVADTIPQYRGFLEQLDSVRDMLGLPAPGAAPVAKPKGKAPTSLLRSEAAEVSGGNPGYADEDEELAAWVDKWRNTSVSP